MADFYTGFLPSWKARSWPTCLKRAVMLTSAKFWCHPIRMTSHVTFTVFQGPQCEQHKAFWKAFFSPNVCQDEMAIHCQPDFDFNKINTSFASDFIGFKVWPLRSIIHANKKANWSCSVAYKPQTMYNNIRTTSRLAMNSGVKITLSHQVPVIAKANESLCDFLMHALTKIVSLARKVGLCILIWLCSTSFCCR